MGQELIQKLLKAEDDAQKIISSAREGRAKKLRDVRTAAEEELVPFRQKEEERFLREQADLMHTQGKRQMLRMNILSLHFSGLGPDLSENLLIQTFHRNKG